MNFDARAAETYANKSVFMTSDDGPNAATSIIIDIAERYGQARARDRDRDRQGIHHRHARRDAEAAKGRTGLSRPGSQRAATFLPS